MDILDGRRAVPGDTVECVQTYELGLLIGPEYVIKLEKGKRYFVNDIMLSGEYHSNVKLSSKHILIFEPHPGIIAPAHFFRIVPEDKKSDTTLVFETKYAMRGT